jgi:heat shock protein HslJ
MPLRLPPLAAAVLLLLTACGSETGADRAEEPPRDDPYAGAYLSDGVPADAFPDGAPPIRLELGERTIAFSADCNRFSGEATWSAGRFSAGLLGGTEMGCPPGPTARDEWMVGFFGSADRIDRDGTDLVIRSGRTEVWFVPVDEVPDPEPVAPLERTPWRLTDIETRDGDSVGTRAVPPHLEASLRILGGEISGSTGCNGYGGSVEVRRGALVIGDLLTTLRACGGVRGEVERAVLAVLRGEVSWQVTGAGLRISRAGTTLVYAPAR